MQMTMLSLESGWWVGISCCRCCLWLPVDTPRVAGGQCIIIISFHIVEALDGGYHWRAVVLKTPKICRFLVNCICTLVPDHQNTRRARMTRPPLVAECRDETICLRVNDLTGPQSISRPDTTERKTLQVELERTPQPTSANQKRATNRRNHKPLLQNNPERTNRNTTETTEGPEPTKITPLARDRYPI